MLFLQNNLLNKSAKSYASLEKFVSNKEITQKELASIIDGYIRTKQQILNKEQIISELEELRE